MVATREVKDAERLKELTLVEEEDMLVIKGRAAVGMKKLLTSVDVWP